MSLQVWLPLNGHLNNQGLENISIINNGATVNDNGKLGKCYSFSSTPLSSQIDITKFGNNFTFCGWVYYTSTTSAQYIFHLGGGTTWKPKYALSEDYSGTLVYYMNGTEYRTSISTGGDKLNNWVHYAFSYDGSKACIYINGELVLSESRAVVSFTPTNNLIIGARANNTAGTAFAYGVLSNGRLNDIRIYNHTLSAKEIKEISKGLVVHYPLDNNGQGDDSTYTDTTVYDTSGYGNNGENQYITYETDTPRYSVSSVLSGSSTRIPNTTINIGNEWSYGLWFKSAAAARSWEGLIILNNNGGDSDIQLGFYTRPNNSQIQTTANGQYNIISHTYDDKWHHLFATFDGTTLKTYRDGELVDTKTIINSLLSRSNLTLGARRKGEVTFDCPYKGSLSDFRLYATALSEDDIRELYETGASISDNGSLFAYEFKEV